MRLNFSAYEWVEIELAFSPEHAQWFRLILEDADIPVYIEAPSILSAVSGFLTAPYRIYVPLEYVEAANVVLDAVEDEVDHDLNND